MVQHVDRLVPLGSDPGVVRIAGDVRGSVRALLVASVLGGLAQALAGTAGSLLARQVGGSDAVAGLPQGFLVAGSALAALAMSRMTAACGRRAALTSGATVAMAGCGVVTVGGTIASLPLILIGCLLLGAGNTAVMLSRYAAADLGPEGSRTAAMASVLVATTVGAVAGPNLLAPASQLAGHLGLPALCGPYLIAALAFAASALTLARGLRFALRPAPGAAGGHRNAHGSRLNRNGLTGLAVLLLANLVMVSVMTMAPMQLRHNGDGLSVIGLVVSVHIAGMFAPSPLSAWLTDHAGGAAAAAAAAVLLVGASSLAAVGAHSSGTLTIAMVLLGASWNLSLISGSTLLTAGVPAGERPRREGWGEVAMGVAAAGGGAGSGAMMTAGGYQLLAAAAAAVAVLVVPIALGGVR
jgi:MFS family permease